ncbi:uncharacterized protein LOC144629974 [Oculina patagonica]
MSLNVRSRNSYFPLRSLPDVVLYHVAEYLSRRDLQNMAQIDRYLRKVFNSPRLWKDIRIRLPDKKIDPQVLEILRVRGITDMEIVNVNFDLQLTTLQPHLERLKLRVTTVNTLQVLCKAASSGHLNKLKSLAFGHIDYRIGHQSKVTFLELFKHLPIMEEVGIGHISGVNAIASSSYTERKREKEIPVPLTIENLLAEDLRQALCCTGKLRSISLTCFSEVGRSWLNTVMLNNPLMQTLSFCCIKSFAGEGQDDIADPKVCSNLRTLELSAPYTILTDTSRIMTWAFPCNKPYKNLTSLDVSGSFVHITFPLLHKFPSLKKLDLTSSLIPVKNVSLESLPNFQNLEWLELERCAGIVGSQLLLLSDKVGKTLRYLGLAWLPLITDTDLRDLATLFPILKTLDLSGCEQITDAVLVEWYIKHEKSEWPKLRKLILKDCKGITQEMVDSVRLKTRNQLLIDL